jgi:hypothetical protein
MVAVPASLLPMLKGFLGTLAALVLVVLVLVIWHLWLDHVTVHQLVAILNTLASKHPDLFK